MSRQVNRGDAALIVFLSDLGVLCGDPSTAHLDSGVGLDGFNQMDLLTGKGPGERKEIFYFSADGDLCAVRIGPWKVTFTEMSGNLPTAWKKTPSWPTIVNLRRDPYKRFGSQSEMYLKWFADRMFFLVPAQTAVAKKLATLKEFPPARGSSLSLGKILDGIKFANPGQ